MTRKSSNVRTLLGGAMILVAACQPSFAQSNTQANFGQLPADGYRPPIVQPTLRDLPPSVAREEGKRTKTQINLDKKLQICRC